MDVSPNDPKTWITGIAALMTSLLTWNFQRFVKQQDRNTDRITALENDRVTKGDVTAVYERIQDLSDQSAKQYHELAQSSHDQHTEILHTLLSQPKR